MVDSETGAQRREPPDKFEDKYKDDVFEEDLDDEDSDEEEYESGDRGPDASAKIFSVLCVVSLLALGVYRYLDWRAHRYDIRAGDVVNVINIDAFPDNSNVPGQLCRFVDIKITSTGDVVRAITDDEFAVGDYAQIRLLPDPETPDGSTVEPSNNLKELYVARRPPH